MNAMSRRQKNRHGLTRMEWPLAIAHSGVDYVCTRLIEASPRAPIATGHPRHVVASHAACHARQPPAHALLAEDMARRQEASQFSGTGDDPWSDGGGHRDPTVKGEREDPRTGRVQRPRKSSATCGADDQDQPRGLHDYAMVELVGIDEAEERAMQRRPAAASEAQTHAAVRNLSSPSHSPASAPYRNAATTHAPHRHPTQCDDRLCVGADLGRARDAHFDGGRCRVSPSAGQKPKSHGAATVAAPCERNCVTTMPVSLFARMGAQRMVGASIVTVILAHSLQPQELARPDHPHQRTDHHVLHHHRESLRHRPPQRSRPTITIVALPFCAAPVPLQRRRIPASHEGRHQGRASSWTTSVA